MRYSVIVTRDTTESTTVTVKARNRSDAAEKALEIASADYGSNVEWTPDDCSGMQSEPYVTGCDEA